VTENHRFGLRFYGLCCGLCMYHTVSCPPPTSRTSKTSKP
jgi:hypothetical protein